MDTASRVCYEFGPFRIDPDREFMLRDGQPVAITPKVFEVLLELVRRDHEVVSKDDLMHTVWPDRIVEEANLSQCIFVLRRLLGDTCEDRRYIVTLPGHGYRFVAPVRTVVQDGRREDILHQPLAEAGSADVAVTLDENAHRAVVRRRAMMWKLVLPAGLVTVVAAAGLSLLLWRSVHATLRAPGPLLVADFTNTTGDPVFDATLRQGLAVQLQQSPSLHLISDDRVQQALRLMGEPADVALTPSLAREVCERSNGGIVLDGSVSRLGNSYVLGLQAKDCQTGRVLDEAQAQADRKEGVLKALDTVATGFRNHIGESLVTIAQHNTPLAEATTSSLEALKAYSEALKVLATSGSAAALPLFQHAVALDPRFAMAYAFQGRMYGDVGAVTLSAQSTHEAWKLREHTSDPERFFIDASYQMQVTGNLQAAQQTCEAWVRTYPAAMIPHAFLGGIIYPVEGEYRKALVESKRVVSIDPDSAVGYTVLAYAYAYLDAFPEAEVVLRRAAQRKLSMVDFTLLGYDLAFLRSDEAGMAREVSNRDAVGVRDWLVYHQALALGYAGRMRKARALSEQAAALATQGSRHERAALFESGAALREAFFGNDSLARQDAEQAMNLSNDRDVEFGAAFALAMANDAAQAAKLADDLESRYPEDTSVHFSYLPALRAQLALDHGQPALAIRLLVIAEPYDSGAPRSSFHGVFGAMYTVYTRGESYLAERNGVAAAAEFQKIVDRPGVIVSDPVGVLARLQLARAYVMQGNTVKAKTAYHDLRDVWKNADQDLPAVREAVAGNARLQ